MKYKILIAVVIAALAVNISSCRKKEVTYSATHKGIVLYNICSNVVIQTLGPEYFGENNWVDENNASKPMYDHVFTVSNPCDFGIHAAGDTITFAFTQPRPQNCAQCLVYVATPRTAYNIQVVK